MADMPSLANAVSIAVESRNSVVYERRRFMVASYSSPISFLERAIFTSTRGVSRIEPIHLPNPSSRLLAETHNPLKWSVTK
jgi:hypothetical protein